MSPDNRPLSRRGKSWCFWFVDTGGNGTLAACKAGYKSAGAANMARYLLQHEGALRLICAQIRRRAPGHQEALRRLMLPSRPAALRCRVAELLSRQMATDPDETPPSVTYAAPACANETNNSAQSLEKPNSGR
jgi:hypothetical protein